MRRRRPMGLPILRRPAGFRRWSGVERRLTSTSRTCCSLFLFLRSTRSRRDGSLLRDGQHGRGPLSRPPRDIQIRRFCCSFRIRSSAGGPFPPSSCLQVPAGSGDVWADALSRFPRGLVWSGSFTPERFAALCRAVGTPGWNLFASPPLCPLKAFFDEGGPYSCGRPDALTERLEQVASMFTCFRLTCTSGPPRGQGDHGAPLWPAQPGFSELKGLVFPPRFLYGPLALLEKLPARLLSTLKLHDWSFSVLSRRLSRRGSGGHVGGSSPKVLRFLQSDQFLVGRCRTSPPSEGLFLVALATGFSGFSLEGADPFPRSGRPSPRERLSCLPLLSPKVLGKNERRDHRPPTGRPRSGLVCWDAAHEPLCPVSGAPCTPGCFEPWACDLQFLFRESGHWSSPHQTRGIAGRSGASSSRRDLGHAPRAHDVRGVACVSGLPPSAPIPWRGYGKGTVEYGASCFVAPYLSHYVVDFPCYCLGLPSVRRGWGGGTAGPPIDVFRLYWSLVHGLRLPPSFPDKFSPLSLSPGLILGWYVAFRAGWRLSEVAIALPVPQASVERTFSGLRYIPKRFKSSATFRGTGVCEIIARFSELRLGSHQRWPVRRHLQRWLDHFPRSSHHIVSGENLINDPAVELCRVQREKSGRPHCLGSSKGRSHPEVSRDTYNILRDFYRPFNYKFYKMPSKFVDDGLFRYPNFGDPPHSHLLQDGALYASQDEVTQHLLMKCTNQHGVSCVSVLTKDADADCTTRACPRATGLETGTLEVTVKLLICCLRSGERQNKGDATPSAPIQDSSESRCVHITTCDSGTPRPTLCCYDPAERHIKAVLQRYPLDMPLEAVLDHPSVILAGRLRAVRDRAPTRQVLVELIGAAPDRLDLGPWGKYSLRHYDREPLRCYRCQRYNHLQGRCQHPVRCGVCSQAHPSEQCIRRHKARQLTTARCPNCFGGHHAWNPRCPERLRRLPGGGRRLQGGGDRPGPQGSFVPAPPPTRPAWGGAGALDTDAEGSRGLASLFHISDTRSSRGTVDHDRPTQRQRRRWKVQARAHHSLGQEAAGPHPSPTPATLSPPMPMPVTVSPVPTPSAALPPHSPTPAPVSPTPARPIASTPPEVMPTPDQASPVHSTATPTATPTLSRPGVTPASSPDPMPSTPALLSGLYSGGLLGMLRRVVGVISHLLARPDDVPRDEGELVAFLWAEIERDFSSPSLTHDSPSSPPSLLPSTPTTQPLPESDGEAPVTSPHPPPAAGRLKVLQWNIQGLRGKRPEVLQAIVEEDLDLVLLQETLTPEHFEWRIADTRCTHYHVATMGVEAV
ncbi:Heparan sulfate glucosamine 3-O-sulfotransferase 3A1 [Chionoecetes opilio]|uniref:Heparan sulfate glucosamine 3-O-sulfotransferase 3A1 n=1 Tax=Chionoecetes opilio TaxID=41210 RepID=A0A8J4XZT3_CHIOP|nr:Heparan sulfate glucosamine 3-O-sulfotransferase 3A1 [Chionoecetes opilio]